MDQKIIEGLKSSIRDVPDFPKKGILFKDLTTIFKSNLLFREMINLITDYYSDKSITKVVGIEARGFITGSVLANNLFAEHM